VTTDDLKTRYTATLTRDNCSAVLVDYLDGFLPGLRSVDRDLYARNVEGYCRTVKALNLPHCVLGDPGGFRGVFFPIIRAEFADSPTFGRHTPSAMRSGDFGAWARARKDEGRTKIVLGGISIDNCTLQTALDLLGEGFEVYVVVDACGAESVLVERAAIDRLIQAGGTPINWTQFACEALGDWQTEFGPRIGGLLQDYSRYGALGVPQDDDADA
jgi:hypothetical protein